jgi:NAD(P)-dependent dehydrogenase (short-subunit alcohol dehydrogenase family)
MFGFMESQNRICIVTGASAGLGLESAIRLADAGYDVVLVCRTQMKAEASAEAVRAKLGRDVRLVPMAADLSVQADIRRLAADIHNQYGHIDVLLNNAGAVFANFQTSADGIEMTMAVNHFNYFLLTNLLLPQLKNAPEGRIINVTSNAHTFGSIDVESFTTRRNYHLLKAYAQSKLANLLFTTELARRLEGTNVTVNAVSPGRVRTEIGSRNQPWLYRFVWSALNHLGAVSIEEGAEMQVSAAMDEQWRQLSGKYMERNKLRNPSSKSKDPQLAATLWEVSEQLCPLRM